MATSSPLLGSPAHHHPLPASTPRILRLPCTVGCSHQPTFQSKRHSPSPAQATTPLESSSLCYLFSSFLIFQSVVKKGVIAVISKGRAKMVAERETTALIFTYGTLKRGFSNHTLLQDLMRTGDAVFVGKYRTAGTYPLVCGPYRVPFLINLPGAGHQVQGELYALSSRGLTRTDELEGTSRGHYERLPIELVEEEEAGGGEEGEEETAVTRAEAYFAHRSYGMEMWKKEGKKKGGGAISDYSDKEAKGYVKRKDRPQNLTFLDHIRLFLSPSTTSTCSSD